LSPAWRARRAFSPKEAWKIEMDLDSEMVRSKNSGLCRAFLTASVRSSRFALGGGVRLGDQELGV
jgi:hypothetical protein